GRRGPIAAVVPSQATTCLREHAAGAPGSSLEPLGFAIRSPGTSRDGAPRMGNRLGLVCFLAIFHPSCGPDVSPMTPGGSMPPHKDGGSSDALPPGGDGATPAPDAGSSVPPGGFVDPRCRDGMYTETLPDPNASLAGVPFTGVAAFVDAALMRR